MSTVRCILEVVTFCLENVTAGPDLESDGYRETGQCMKRNFLTINVPICVLAMVLAPAVSCSGIV